MTATIVQIAGIACAVIAGFLIAVWVGFAVAAVCLVALGVSLER